jgi:hypothetical protein
MRMILLLFAVIAALGGIGAYGIARDATQQLHAALWILMAAVLFAGCAIVEQLQLLRGFVERERWIKPVDMERGPAPPVR